MDTPRKGIRSEFEYAQSAPAVLLKQRERLVRICEAFVQAASWIRAGDLQPEEEAMRDHAEKFVATARKKAS